MRIVQNSWYIYSIRNYCCTLASAITWKFLLSLTVYQTHSLLIFYLLFILFVWQLFPTAMTSLTAAMRTSNWSHVQYVGAHSRPKRWRSMSLFAKKCATRDARHSIHFDSGVVKATHHRIMDRLPNRNPLSHHIWNINQYPNRPYVFCFYVTLMDRFWSIIILFSLCRFAAIHRTKWPTSSGSRHREQMQ